MSEPAVTVVVRRVTTAEELATCLRLRWTVFIEEQGVPPSLERDGYDRVAAPGAHAEPIHALAESPSRWKAQPVPTGAGRITWLGDGLAKVQRMAVVADARGKGVGAALLRFLEDEARKAGARRFTLGAQLTARGFYKKLGYQEVGEVFLDAGIEHIKMEKEA